MAAIIVPPFKLSSSTTIVPRSSSVTLLQGNAGGFNISGGPGSTDNLELMANSQTFSFSNTGRIYQMERILLNLNDTQSANVTDSFLKISGTLTTSASVNIVYGYEYAYIFSYSTAQILSTCPSIYAHPVFSPSAALTDNTTQYAGFLSAPKYSPNNTGTNTTPLLVGYNANPVVNRDNASATVNVTTVRSYMSYGGFTFSNFIQNCTVTDLEHFSVQQPSTTSATITNQYGLRIAANTASTNIYGVHSALASATNTYFIYGTGTAQSVHTGLFNFGSTTAPLALVDIDGSTTARSSVCVKAGTAPTSPNNGDLWHDSTRQCYMVYCGGMSLGLKKVAFTQTANANVASSTSETTIIGTGIGTVTLAASFLTVGKTLRVRAYGFYGTKAAPVGTFTLKLKYGTTVLITISPTLTASLSNQQWEATFDITCRTTGATGTVFAQGSANFWTVATTAGPINAVTTSTTTIDTTTSNKLDLTVQWGTSNASNTITSTNYTMEVLF